MSFLTQITGSCFCIVYYHLITLSQSIVMIDKPFPVYRECENKYSTEQPYTTAICILTNHDIIAILHT